jgi:hypothetical protein
VLTLGLHTGQEASAVLFEREAFLRGEGCNGEARHPCRPCGRDGCGCGKVGESLTTLTVERVFEAAQRLLK